MSESTLVVSVVVAMRNEENYIAPCLQSVIDQDYPGEQVEILIMDGMSTDSSRDIVSEFARGAQSSAH